MLFKLARKVHCIQDLYIKLSTSIHPAIVHSAGIIEILKKALWQTTMEGVEGGYFEFGVYEGTSMLSAVKIYRTINSGESATFLGRTLKRNFYGFDSFEDGFKYHNSSDIHPVFREGNYSSSYVRCKSRLAKYSEVHLVKGYFEETLIFPRIAEIIPDEEKCAVVFIDCDLKVPALLALNYIRPKLQKGSVIILDDIFSYKGDPNSGVAGAWEEFLMCHPNLKVRPFYTYGCMGQSYIVFDL